jgi:nickel superoxide dismutase
MVSENPERPRREIDLLHAARRSGRIGDRGEPTWRPPPRPGAYGRDALHDPSGRHFRIDDHNDIPGAEVAALVAPNIHAEPVAGTERRQHALVMDFDPAATPPAGRIGPNFRPHGTIGIGGSRHPYPTRGSRGIMSVTSSSRRIVERLVDAVVPPRAVFAHCDIPCGIYDPTDAQLSALTILRMDQLIAEAVAPAMDAKAEERSAYISKVSRYTAVKEQHAERLKNDVRVIWGDFFTPDHAKQFPQIHELTWKILKQASKARQGTNVADAQELLKMVQEFSEVFWQAKGSKTHRVPSMQKPGGELVVPAA